MHKIDIPESGIVKEIPSTIDEMNEEQYLFFIGLVLRHLEGELSIDKLKMLLAYKLLEINMNPKFYLFDQEIKDEIWQNIYVISQVLNSYFKVEQRDGKPVNVIQLNSVHNFIPCICKKYYGPADALQDVTFREYRMAHDYMRKYMIKGDEEHLNYMIAVLYRPKKRFLWLRKQFRRFNGEERIPFTGNSNPNLLHQRVKKIAQLPLVIRYSIYLFMTGCEDYLATGEPMIGENRIKLSILYEKSEESEDTEGIGLVGLLYSLAETKVFGSIEETDNQNLWDVMARLYQVMQNMKKMESYGKGKNI